MALQPFKLANVVVKLGDHLREFPQVLYNAQGPVDYSFEDGSLAFSDTIDFTTYFNALSYGKWMQYTNINNAFLHLELVGDPCKITMMCFDDAQINASYMGRRAKVEGKPLPTDPVLLQLGETTQFDGSADYLPIDIQVPEGSHVLVGFKLESEGATAIRNAYWYTFCEPSRLNHVHIALSTTTFKKEEFILPNIQAVKDEVLGCSDPIANAFHMFVVDNGKTLNVAEINDENVTVIPNANVGGSGGFARGMMAALESDKQFTHILLMDDDVVVSTESFKRTFSLLSLASEKYKNAYINGAMLAIERPNMQFEDVAFVANTGIYQKVKKCLFMDSVVDAALNEVVNVEVPNAYGAWWFSCIPMSVVREYGLPLPLFVRCDDVEYGARTNPTYMTMNGICVWHAGFDDKFRAPIDCYQFMRNYAVMMSCDDKSVEKLFMMRSYRTLQLYLSQMAYEAAELIVSAFEDYMRGPEHLMHTNGEKLLMQNNAKSEKLAPIGEALKSAAEEHPELADKLANFKPRMNMLQVQGWRQNPVLKLMRTIPVNRHNLPENMLRDAPATAFYGGVTRFAPEQVASRVIVACDRSGENAHVRVMDKERYNEIMNRWNTMKADYDTRKDDVRKAYKDAMPTMTSVEFWKEFLARAENGE